MLFNLRFREDASRKMHPGHKTSSVSLGVVQTRTSVATHVTPPPPSLHTAAEHKQPRAPRLKAQLQAFPCPGRRQQRQPAARCSR